MNKLYKKDLNAAIQEYHEIFYSILEDRNKYRDTLNSLSIKLNELLHKIKEEDLEGSTNNDYYLGIIRELKDQLFQFDDALFGIIDITEDELVN